MIAPLVTVVIPCFGEGRYLDDCLHSVRSQDHTNLEILVVDDAGTDDSLAIAVEHQLVDPRVEAVALRTNVGLGAVRNIATAMATGTLITFLDGDDLLAPDAIRTRVAALTAAEERGETQLAGAFGDWHPVPPGTHRWRPTGPSRDLVTVDFAGSSGGNVFIVSAPIVKRDVLIEAGGFAEGLAGGEDYVAWMRVLSRGYRFVPTAAVVAAYRQKATSMVLDSAHEYLTLSSAGREWWTDRQEGPSSPGPSADGSGAVEFGTIAAPSPTLPPTSGDDAPFPHTDDVPAPPPRPTGDTDLGRRLTEARQVLEATPTAAVPDDAVSFQRVVGGVRITPWGERAHMLDAGTPHPVALVIEASSTAAGLGAIALADLLRAHGIATDLRLTGPGLAGALRAVSLGLGDRVTLRGDTAPGPLAGVTGADRSGLTLTIGDRHVDALAAFTVVRPGPGRARTGSPWAWTSRAARAATDRGTPTGAVRLADVVDGGGPDDDEAQTIRALVGRAADLGADAVDALVAEIRAAVSPG